MNSLNFPDINVWLALAWGRHSHAAAAREWFESREDEQFLFCRFTQLGLLRLLTTAAVMGADVQSMPRSWQTYDEWFTDDRIAFLDEPAGLEARFRSFARSPHAAPKLWADAYLAAFASSAGLRLVTFDKGFRSKPLETVVLAQK